MTRKVVVARERGSPREELRRIEGEEARQEEERLERLCPPLRSAKVLGSDGKVVSDFLGGGGDLRDFFEALYLGNPLLKGWVRDVDRKHFSEETGFREDMYRRESRGYSQQRAERFCSEHGFQDVKSYGRFISLGYSHEMPAAGGLALQRVFFACLADPLFRELQHFRNRDEALKNFSSIVDEIPGEMRVSLFLRLSEHPNALRNLLGINHFDQNGLKDFFTRFTRNPACFDGIVRR
ncbi:MAG: hypothetical protein FJY77_06040 [Candidatus Altiarchaeales archaeon]|nr:hypothetical protein [Candidatus Altiarchaeales archaeon]